MGNATLGEKQLSEDIERYRTRRLQALGALLRKLPGAYVEAVELCPHPVLRWALAHHLYHTAVQAGRSTDTESAVGQLSGWLSTGPDLHAPGRRTPVVTDVANTREILIGTEMPVNAVDPKKLFEGGRAEGHQTVAEAVSILALLGYGAVIDEGAAIVVLLKKRQLGQETSSWATAAFPATVYLDWYDHPEFLAKDLLHEASHAWLNDALEARQINLPEEALFYSPWKKRDRPAYGMIHSVFAFSRVTNCLTRLRDHTTDPAVRTYCDIRVHEERRRLAEARSAALAALSVLPDAQLTDLVRGEYEEALTAHGRPG